MAKLTLNDIPSGFFSNTAYNTNNGLIETALENTLSRDGTSPNQMGANLDMNSYPIVNLGAPANATSAARLQDISDSDATGAASAALRAELLLASDTTGGQIVGFKQEGTGAVTTRKVQDKLREFVSVKDFGAIGDGVTDDSIAIQAAFTAHSKIFFPPGTYLIGTGIVKTGSNIEVDFGQAIIKNNGVSFTFTFGTRSNTPLYTGLVIKKGRFEQVDPATTSNFNFIRVAGTKDFEINGCHLKNCANGGIYIEAGCEDGIVNGVTIDGKAGYAAAQRGIWLAGDTATDFADQLVDTTSITRNATPVPVYAVKNIKITNCTIIFPEYGIYFMNTRDCTIENCYIDISGVGATRCIALNSYSPGAKVINNTLISDRSSTGILVTQVSNNVMISGNLFKGTFGGNRDIYVQYLSEALIQNNKFNTTGTQNIQIDMGGIAYVKNNEFNKEARTEAYRCVYIVPIDPSQAGTGTIGNTATSVGGVLFQGNTVRFRPLAVYADTNNYPSTSGNKPSLTFVKVKGNIFMNMEVALTSSDAPLILETGTSANITPYTFTDNEVVPYTFSNWNYASVSGGSYYDENTQAYIAMFQVTVAASGGAITVVKQTGANFSLSVSRSGANLTLVPRFAAGTASAGVASPVGIVDKSGTIFTHHIIAAGANFTFSALDSGATPIDFSVTGGSFMVFLGPAQNT